MFNKRPRAENLPFPCLPSKKPWPSFQPRWLDIASRLSSPSILRVPSPVRQRRKRPFFSDQPFKGASWMENFLQNDTGWIKWQVVYVCLTAISKGRTYIMENIEDIIHDYIYTWRWLFKYPKHVARFLKLVSDWRLTSRKPHGFGRTPNMSTGTWLGGYWNTWF